MPKAKTSSQSRAIGLATAAVIALVASSASAQGRYDRYDERDNYRYCHERAVGFSGYRGRVPDRYLPGGALEGAAKGSGLGALGSILSGDSRKERKRAERRGAIIGGIVGAIKRGEARKEERRKARIYRLELDACMASAR